MKSLLLYKDCYCVSLVCLRSLQCSLMTIVFASLPHQRFFFFLTPCRECQFLIQIEVGAGHQSAVSVNVMILWCAHWQGHH